MNSIQIRERKRGRPPKKDYDTESLMHELIDAVSEVYNNTNEIKATAIELSLPPHKVKKLLITGKVIYYPETEQILSLQQQGKTMEEIENIMGISYSTINTYLPYSKVIYKLSEISQNAGRVRRYNVRKNAVNALMELSINVRTANPYTEVRCGWHSRKQWRRKAVCLLVRRRLLMSEE